MSLQILQSVEDASVNFVCRKKGMSGVFESRYVERAKSRPFDPEYFAVYLSVQSGCNQGCEMCHLTATGQNKFINADREELLRQADVVLAYYEKKVHEGKRAKAEVVHYNFMARGEALANREFLKDNQSIFWELSNRAVRLGLVPRFLISTIMPQSVSGVSLSKTFHTIAPEMYYSLYSVKPDFRKRWLPHAMPVSEALATLVEYQRTKRMIPKIHFAFIEGQNDDMDDMISLCQQVLASGLRANFAIVRYNPYIPGSERYGREPDEEIIDRNAAIIKSYFPDSDVKKIVRVGFDVKASCGMFVAPDFAN